MFHIRAVPLLPPSNAKFRIRKHTQVSISRTNYPIPVVQRPRSTYLSKTNDAPSLIGFPSVPLSSTKGQPYYQETLCH
jgi:hypothetical protein